MGIRLGVVGCGAFGSSFIGLFKKHPAVSRLALCDLSPDLLRRRAEQHQVSETYDSLDAICASDLDALAIITQHWMHAPQAIQALAAGKHVYTAVPAAWTLEECDLLVDAVRRSGLVYMNGETTWFRAEADYLRRRHAAGDFGRLISLDAEYLHDVDHGLREVAQRRFGPGWTLHHSGGVPMHYPSHSLAFPISITNSRVTHVSCHGFVLPGDDWFRADTATGNVISSETALCELACGANAVIREYRRVGHPGAERITRVLGTEASYEEAGGTRLWCSKQGCQPVSIPADFEPLPAALAADKGGHGGSHAYLVHEFVECVRTGRLPRPNIWQAVRCCAPGHVAHESALRDGERLPVPDWGDPPA
ncbi:MAG: Gfo/Idh/MocA family oxidoreductase [Fimbriimonadaceae bacterium]|nr:Gfo/Idh/MocA family oxidoreductase [Fimbriimonadaceae bacterium]